MRANPRDPLKSAYDDGPDVIRPSATAAGVNHRKKGTGVRAWLLIDPTGQTQVVEAGKHAIMRQTGLPARDLRILDPLLSYPSTILGRERAIVINLEHIKAIITAHEVLLLNSRDPSVTPFVEELQRRILHHHQATKAQAKTLEQEAHPALDKLTSKISTLNLERVRQIKSRLVAITGRVQKVRDELEHLLDDDEDMAEMYLTDKLEQQLEDSSASSMNDKDDMEGQELQTNMDGRIPAEISLETGGGSACYEDHQNTLGRDSHGTRTSITYSTVTKQLDVEELEMLLEAYFVQIDGTLNKLSTLREYVDDTEDYINIMLDDKQNHLLQMGVMLTTATLVVSAFVVVAGIFGMNIHIELFETGMREFLWTVGGSTAGTIFLYVFAIAWCKHKRLLE
ncbi:magnesium transporter MRS2-3 isoform X2 [Prosopis cineraria]|uniref:magnesium transporter MRS2-3 isoform X2 n=1 Tax=Prosopis cineraria TaxID=364024 RepID=UPI00240FA0E2|nr:magnesium transporter MRS2-3 isoform X2 [Prosopis cineraria]